MLRNKSISLVVLALMLAVLAFRPTATVHAQDNLLSDAGFENTGIWKNVADRPGEGASFNVAPAWNGWFTETPRSADWQNRVPNGFPHNSRFAGDPFVRGGNRAQNIGRGQATFTAAIFQSVTVPEGANVIGSAWVVMDLNLNSSPNAQARVGIDPNGGGNPLDSDIIWSSPVVNGIGNYRQMTVNATATGPAVTIFLWASQSAPSDPNGVFWDDASLVLGGDGGAAPGQTPQAPAATPVPTAPPSVPLVPPQPPEADGSQYHVIQPNDTIASIAVAYGVSRDSIIELNNIANPGLISVGRRLLIRPAPTLVAPEETDEPEPTARPTRTPRPTEEPDDEEPDETEEPVAVAQADTDDDEPEATEEVEETEEVEPTETPTPTETETETPTPTETPLPTDTPAPTATVAVVAEAEDLDLSVTTASLCIMIYDDANADAERQTEEATLSGGTVFLQKDGADIQSLTLDGTSEMDCFEALEPGQYIVNATAPDGYVLLPSSRSRPNLPVGQQVNVAFAAVDADSVANVPAPEVDTANNPETAADLAIEETPDEDDDLLQNAGLIVLVLAGLTLVTGVVVSLALRGR